MKTLLCFSGGTDSSYILWKLLTTTDEEITAFRVQFPTGYDHAGISPHHWHPVSMDGESLMAPLVVAELQAIGMRPFEYIEAPITAEEADPMLSRGHCAVKLAAEYALANGFDRVALGREANHILPKGGMKHWLERLELHNSIAPLIPLETPLLEWHQAKPHGRAYLPASVLALVANCGQPTIVDGVYTRCNDYRLKGDCYSNCRNRNLIDEGLAAGVTPDTLLDFRMRKTGIGPYEGIIAPDPDYRQGR